MSEIDTRLVGRILRLRHELKDAERKLSDQVVAACGYAKGSLVRDKDTGALYRVDGGSAGLYAGGQTYCHLHCTRVYKTGRRPARSTSIISVLGVEPYDGEVPNAR